MVRRSSLVALLVMILATPAAAENRGLLWRVVQACLLNHSLTGAAFPCLYVDARGGPDRGYAVVREPGDRTRLIVVPTVPTRGVEAKRLRGITAPNYFQDAWASRRFVGTQLSGANRLAVTPSRGDLALAVNSRPGRSQDQLHIHVACIRADVKRAVLAKRDEIRADRWATIEVLPGLPYTARFIPGSDLTGINLFDRAAKALKADTRDMENVTILVMGADVGTTKGGMAMPAGFIVMARDKRDADDAPHAEALLDPSCRSLRPPSGS